MGIVSTHYGHDGIMTVGIMSKNQNSFGTSRNFGSCHQMAAKVAPTEKSRCREILEVDIRHENEFFSNGGGYAGASCPATRWMTLGLPVKRPWE